MSKKGKKKEVGKVVKRRRRRVRISIPRIRWDIVIIVIIVGLIISATLYMTLGGHKETPHKLTIDDLKNYLRELASGNKSIALDLIYEVRGDLPTLSEVLGIKDYLQVDIRYYEITVAPPKGNVSNTTTSTNTSRKLISGYLTFYYGLDYAPILRELLGMTLSVDNLSQVLVDIVFINKSINGSVKILETNYDYVELRDLGKVKALKKVIEYIRVINGTEFHVVITEWVDDEYGVPLKVILRINGYELKMDLIAFSTRRVGMQPT